MNLQSYESLPRRLGFQLRQALRRIMPPVAINAFGTNSSEGARRIQHIYVINLNRQTRRWRRMQDELAHLLGDRGVRLNDVTFRFPAVDAKTSGVPDLSEVDPVYHLSEQLFVEPHPRLAGSAPAEDMVITSTRQEIAVARSHIEVWKRVATSECDYALILEDDVYFNKDARQLIDGAWSDLHESAGTYRDIDMLYLSYREAGPTSKKQHLSEALIRPVRGFWQLSGYVLSKEGAQKLLRLLPVRGPVDLWINHQFDKIHVFATAKSAIDQRPDAGSNNSYSIQPILATTGALTGSEHDKLMKGNRTRTFDAYVNVDPVSTHLTSILRANRSTRLILSLGDEGDLQDRDEAGPSDPLELLGMKSNGQGLTLESLDLDPARILILRSSDADKWARLCEFLGRERPDAQFPSGTLDGRGHFPATHPRADPRTFPKFRALKYDASPWIAPSCRGRTGGKVRKGEFMSHPPHMTEVNDRLRELDLNVWRPLAETFPSNTALFVPRNLTFGDTGARFVFRKERTSVRDYTSASFRSQSSYRYGRFEAEIRSTRCSGLITALFLHRFSPRQEIDIELLGRSPTKMLINVYYNPGDEGAELNYGYRGTPVEIDLGFDASQDFHRYAIEWEPTGIRWFVDDNLVHERASWDPTPIPHLPMQFFLNLWSSRSKEFSGRLDSRMLPAHSEIRSVHIRGYECGGRFAEAPRSIEPVDQCVASETGGRGA